MNLRRIITEAINNTLLDNDKRIIDQNCQSMNIDTMFWSRLPQQEQQFAKSVFRYGLSVSNAISAGNILPNDPTQQAKRQYKDYYREKNRTRYIGNPGRAVLSQLADMPNAAADVFKSSGIDFGPFNGLWTNAVNNYKEGYNSVRNPAMDAMRRKDAEKEMRKDAAAAEAAGTANSRDCVYNLVQYHPQYVMVFNQFNTQGQGLFKNTYVEHILSAIGNVRQTVISQANTQAAGKNQGNGQVKGAAGTSQTAPQGTAQQPQTNPAQQQPTQKPLQTTTVNSAPQRRGAQQRQRPNYPQRNPYNKGKFRNKYGQGGRNRNNRGRRR